MKQWLIVGAIFAALLVFAGFQQNAIDNLKQERNRYERNTESLLLDVAQYKTRDSLNAAKVGALELTIQEYERFRAADAKLIKTLKTKNRDLTAITAAQSQTIMELSAIPRDTVIIRDSVAMPAVAVHTGDAWYDFDGILTEQEFTGTLVNRDSLLVAETVQYKRFLGFLWKTKRIKNKQIDVVSKNPHTTIMGIEYIEIEK